MKYVNQKNESWRIIIRHERPADNVRLTIESVIDDEQNPVEALEWFISDEGIDRRNIRGISVEVV